MSICKKCSVCSVCEGTTHLNNELYNFAEVHRVTSAAKIARLNAQNALSKALEALYVEKSENVDKLVADAQKLADIARIQSDRALILGDHWENKYQFV